MASHLQLCLGFLLLSAFLLTLDAKRTRVVSSSLSNKRRTASQTVEVTFRIDEQVAFGQGFVVTGNTSQFGNWDPKSGIQLEYSATNIWSATVNVTSGSAIEFKPVRVVFDTKEPLEWLYLPENLVLLVPSTDPSVTVLVFWCAAPSSSLFTKKGTFTKISKADEQKVTFQLEKRVEFGQGIAIAGSPSELGSWTPQNGLALSYDAGVWTGNVSLPSGSSFEYKPVRVVYGSNDPLEWAQDPNRNAVIPEDIDEPVIIPVRWTSCPSGGSVEILISEVV